MNAKSLILVLTLVLATTTCVLASAEEQEVILHNFGVGDSNSPSVGLVSDAKGNLYGVTGAYGVECGSNCGTVFELSPSSAGWNFSTLYVFKGGMDGSAPQGPLILDADGNLYGTTATGGGTCPFYTLGCGTVFKLSPNSNGGWSETVLHRFTHTSDGALPFYGVIQDSSGNLYGSTDFAGVVSTACPQGCGTIYKLTPGGSSWTFSVVHTFTGGSDGAFGGSLVFDSMGNLYGAAGGGGTVNNHCGGDGCGVLFKLTPTGNEWTESVIYTFNGGADGLTPVALIFDAEGNLYGITLYGGHGDPTTCSPLGCGTVFKLTPSGSTWNFTLLHAFIGGDGANPSGIILDAKGDLYGTAERGGPSCCGTVFKLASATNWKQTLIHPFTGKDDGGYPYGGVILDTAGNLYGTTSGGGTLGSGVAFEILQ